MDSPSSTSSMNDLASNDDKIADLNIDDEEVVAYETSYTKFNNRQQQQQQSGSSSNNTKSRTRRRGGYGSAAAAAAAPTTSVLESLSTTNNANATSASGDTTSNANNELLEQGAPKHTSNDKQHPHQHQPPTASNDGEFLMDMGDFAMENDKKSSSMFNMETQDDDNCSSMFNDEDDSNANANNDSDDDDDEATRPYVESDIDLDNNVAEAKDAGSDDDDEGELSDAMEDEEEEIRPKGRTKQTKKMSVLESITTTAAAATASDDMLHKQGGSDDEGELLEQSERFSLGESQAVKEAMAMGMEENSQKNEGEMDNVPNSKGGDDDEDECEGQAEPATTHDTPEAEEEAQSIAPTEEAEAAATTPSTTPSNSKPTHDQVLTLVDSLFEQADKDTMTVKGINKQVSAQYGWKKIKKGDPLKEMIKTRLTDLTQQWKKADKENEENEEEEEVQGSDESGGEEEDGDDDYESEPDAGANDSGSEYEEARTTSKKKKKGKKSKKSNKANADAYDSDDSINDSDDITPKKKKSSKSKGKRRSSTRSSTKKSAKGKMAKHLRDSHTKARLRQLEEARIRKEELGHLENDDDKKKMKAQGIKGEPTKPQEEKEAGPVMSEQDRARGDIIRERFNTNREELRMQRVDDRLGLVDRMRQKRLETIQTEVVDVTAEMDWGDAELLAFKKNKQGVKEEEEEERPKLTCGGGLVKEEGKEEKVKKEKKPINPKMMVLEDDSSDESDDDDDDLEIMAPPAKSTAVTINDANSSKSGKKMSTVDLLFSGNMPRRDPQKARKKVVNARSALRNALVAKTYNRSNTWLAKELGYRSIADHMSDCQLFQEEKRVKYQRIEEMEAEMDKKRRVDLLRMEKEGILPEEEEEKEFVDAGADEKKEEIVEEEEEEENEELAIARQMGIDVDEPVGAEGEEENGNGSEENEQAGGPLEQAEKSKSQVQTDNSEGKPMLKDMDATDDTATPTDEATTSSPSKETTTPGSVVTPLRAPTEATSTSETPAEEAPEMAYHDAADPFAGDAEEAESKEVDTEKSTVEDDSAANNDAGKPADDNEAEAEFSDSPAKPKKPRNSAWKAMLAKDKATHARQKKLQRKSAGLVDGEAEEEEDEDQGIAGLEDFGFAIERKDKGEEDADADISDDDLENVVDELSDNEGDEEAGEQARKRLERAEEKARHKDLMRRMREGFTGTRGGIVASGAGGARGTMRFDQLVAADNGEEARRLGLLNDDELNSDEEGEGGKNGYDEEEDEAAFLDRAMKERIKGKQEQLEENFTDDEGSEDELEVTGENKDGYDEDGDEREQERLAKHFEKRARRNRALDMFEGDGQFSRSRLIDEDVSMKQDLKTMKTSFFRKRSYEGSNLGNLDLKENNGTSKKVKGGISDDKSKDSSKPTSSFVSREGGLSVALTASRRTAGRKRKTTFLSGKSSSCFSKSHSGTSSSSKSVSLNHVVFGMASEASQSASQFEVSNHSFLGTAKSRGGSAKGRSKPAKRGSSLWSKVQSKNFRAS